jgi:hypothetical protein
MKHSLFVASNDLNHALQPMVHQLLCFDAPKDKIISSVSTAAQRSLYLKITDIAAGFDVDLLPYRLAQGCIPNANTCARWPKKASTWQRFTSPM